MLTACERIGVSALGGVSGCLLCRLGNILQINTDGGSLKSGCLSSILFQLALALSAGRRPSPSHKKEWLVFDELITVESEFQAFCLGNATALVLARRGLFRILPSNHYSSLPAVTYLGLKPVNILRFNLSQWTANMMETNGPALEAFELEVCAIIRAGELGENAGVVSKFCLTLQTLSR